MLSTSEIVDVAPTMLRSRAWMQVPTLEGATEEGILTQYDMHEARLPQTIRGVHFHVRDTVSRLFLIAGLAFVEEILPGFDVIPTATIAWFLSELSIPSETGACQCVEPNFDNFPPLICIFGGQLLYSPLRARGNEGCGANCRVGADCS